MLYLWIKALHLIAVIVLIAGLVTMATAFGARLVQAEWRRVARRADYAMASPALGVVWITGPVLAVMGNWWHAPWFMAKLVLVIVVSALHGRLSATLRRLDRQGRNTGPTPTNLFTRALPVVLVAMAGIVALVIVKPF
ncbi:hypothetical protein PCA31118_04175 [Pandoraea captiosa]|uniref:Protoporphyrinogen IX oxidase n=1 Tax=Pandoraea captiosa TaxID=2508302 RepID=A0A5E5AHW2_9BURK|nr:CopD family protein [Pandoraea captiosa]VVE72402.1 hypothetical protein PCA31118_04175 [Pandoraea captiosa]